MTSAAIIDRDSSGSARHRYAPDRSLRNDVRFGIRPMIRRMIRRMVSTLRHRIAQQHHIDLSGRALRENLADWGNLRGFARKASGVLGTHMITTHLMACIVCCSQPQHIFK